MLWRKTKRKPWKLGFNDYGVTKPVIFKNYEYDL